MLDTNTKRRIDTARDILVGKVPDPKSQVEQITIALIYKFMDDMDMEAVELGREDVLKLYIEALADINVNPTFNIDDYKAVGMKWRTIIPEFIKDYISINKFVA